VARWCIILILIGWCACSAILWLHATGRITLHQRTESLILDRIVEEKTEQDSVYVYRFSRVVGDPSDPTGGSKIVLLEDGQPLNAIGGAFQLIDSNLRFSASDRSDPRTNGRRYEVRYAPWTKPRHQTQYLFLFILGIALSIFFVVGVPMAMSVSRAIHRVPTHPSPLVETAQPRGHAGPFFRALSIVSVVFVSLLVPATSDLGFNGDDWNLVFTRMDGHLFSDFMASCRFFLNSQRPTPLQCLSLAVLHKLFGAEPEGYFLCAFAAMAACAMLIGVIVRTMTRSDFAALAAAVAWLAFPIKNQALYSINAGTGKWQGSIYISLAILFYIYSLTRSARKRWAIASAVMYVFSLLCYEQAVAVLPVFVVAEWFWSRRRFPQKLFLGAFWLHGLLTAAFVVIRTTVLDASNPNAYHIETGFISAPWEWLRTLWGTQSMQWYGRTYSKAMSSLSWEALREPAAVCFFISVLLAGGLLFRAGKNRAPAFEPFALRKSLIVHGGFALLGLTLFVAPQAFLLFLSTTPEERMVVFSSIGLSFLIGQAFGLVDSAIAAARFRWVKRIGEMTLVLILAAAGACMANRVVQEAVPYAEAGRITRSVYAQLQQASETVRSDQQVVILGTPWLMRNRAIVFTANYAIKGCVRSALNRDVSSERAHGGISIVPTENGYQVPFPHSQPEMTAFVHNLFTSRDRPDPFALWTDYDRDHTGANTPWTDYDKLALFTYNGSQLRRVNVLHFQNVTGNWREKVLANVPTGIDLRFPRIAKIVETPQLLPSARPVHLRSSSIELTSFALRREPNLMDTYHVQIIWKKHRPDAADDVIRLGVHVETAAGIPLWSYNFFLDSKELSRQLDSQDWREGQFLQQDFLINETSGVTTENWIDRVGRIWFVLQSTPPDSTRPPELLDSIIPLNCDLSLVLDKPE